MIRSTDRRRAARLVAAALLASAIVVACGLGAPTGAGWRDPGVHEVAGIWITGEEPCGPDTGDDLCRAVRAAALEDPRAATATAVSLGHLPFQWVTANGDHILGTTGGIAKAAVAIVDLADGSRVAIGLVCDPPISAEGQSPRPPACYNAPDIVTPYRVGGRGPGS